MILGIGYDIAEIARIEKAISNAHFLERVFTSRERGEVLQSGARQAPSAAANFAAKEALSKAMGCGLSGISLGEISVLRDERGAPYILAEGKTKVRLDVMGVTTIWVSLTHDAGMAGAMVVLEGGGLK